MKIVCDSCSAKYSIADEKVAGKVFKIRCKKCSNVIVVRGDHVEAGNDEDEATRVFDYGGDAAWHLVLDGEQQGPFTPLQIAGMISDGTIDYESYVWKEGFDGWKALSDVPELMAALGSGGDSHAVSDEADSGAAADPFAASAGGGLFASAPSSGGANDLFAGGGGGGGLFGGGDGAPSDDVVASKPGPRVSGGEAMTGQRNENSVLFSLSNLQALATGDSSPKPASGSAASSPLMSGGGGGGGGLGLPASSGMAMGEGSGLIDIRALATATSSLPMSSAAKSSGNAVDDLLSIGVGPSLGSALGAPVLAPVAAEPVAAPVAAQQGGSNKVVLIAAAVAVLAAVGAVAFVLTREPEIQVVTQQAPAATTTDTAGTAGAGTTADPGAAAGAATPPPTPGTEGTAAAPEAAAATGSDTSGTSGSSTRRTGTTTSAGSTTRPSTGSTTTEMAASSTTTEMAASTAAETPMTSTMSSSIDDLLGMAVAPMADTGGDLPDTPSRSAVSSALGGRAAAVRACGNGATGTATVAVTFASSGRVTSANVTGGPFAGNSCIANAVRGARVPPFRQATFDVNFPYRL